MFYNINISPMLVTKYSFMLTDNFSIYNSCPMPLMHVKSLKIVQFSTVPTQLGFLVKESAVMIRRESFTKFVFQDLWKYFNNKLQTEKKVVYKTLEKI